MLPCYCEEIIYLKNALLESYLLNNLWYVHMTGQPEDGEAVAVGTNEHRREGVSRYGEPLSHGIPL